MLALHKEKTNKIKLSNIFYPIEKQKLHITILLFGKDIWIA